MTTLPTKPLITAYKKPSPARAAWQILNSVGLYLALWAAMSLTADVSWWLTMPLAVLAGAVLVRVFIIFHDCGHGSFLASRAANDGWGFVTGVLTFTPYAHWRWQHAIHHGSTGNLDRRGVGDMWTLTLDEYRQAPLWKRLAYRAARNPIVLLGITPLAMFLLAQRVPNRRAGARERHSVWQTNICLLGLGIGLSAILGFLPFLIIQSTILAVAGAIGIWLFYSQHQFEGAYWARRDDWDYDAAALKGSAYLKLPRILQWFTGNIGYHHIHHLSARIPNYNLQACHESHSVFEGVTPLTILGSFRAFGLKLWDEANGRLVGFREARRARTGLGRKRHYV
ncbi:MAG: fatty acid desaturase [Planctomycetota bacterium]